MNRHLISFLLTAALTATAASQLLSAQGPTMTGSVPFAFNIGQSNFGPGAYTVSKGTANGVVRIQSDPSDAEYFTTFPQAIGEASAPKLTFVCHGSDCALASVAMPDGAVYGVLSTAKQQQMTRKLSLSAEIRTVRLRAR